MAKKSASDKANEAYAKQAQAAQINAMQSAGSTQQTTSQKIAGLTGVDKTQQGILLGNFINDVGYGLKTLGQDVSKAGQVTPEGYYTSNGYFVATSNYDNRSNTGTAATPKETITGWVYVIDPTTGKSVPRYYRGEDEKESLEALNHKNQGLWQEELKRRQEASETEAFNNKKLDEAAQLRESRNTAAQENDLARQNAYTSAINSGSEGLNASNTAAFAAGNPNIQNYLASNKNLATSTQNDWLQKQGYANALNLQANNLANGAQSAIASAALQGAGQGAQTGASIGGFLSNVASNIFNK